VASCQGAGSLTKMRTRRVCQRTTASRRRPIRPTWTRSRSLTKADTRRDGAPPDRGLRAVARENALASGRSGGIFWGFPRPPSAGVAQSAEHRFCKPTVVSSTLTASSRPAPAALGRDLASGRRDASGPRPADPTGRSRDRAGWIPKWLKGPDCKSGGNAFAGSNPAPPIAPPPAPRRIGRGCGEPATIDPRSPSRTGRRDETTPRARHRTSRASTVVAGGP